MKKYNIKVNDQNFLVDVEQITPEKLNIKINNNIYSVNIEELIPLLKQTKETDGEKQSVKPSVQKTVISPVQAQQGENELKSMKTPMAGIITKVSINVNDKINRGELVCAIDSMKMESDIFSSISGTVKNVFIKKNDTVKNNQILFEIE